MKLHTDPTAMDPRISPGRLLDVNQVADVLGCGRTMVYTLFDRGELRQVKIGRLTRVPSSEVDRYLRRQMGIEDRYLKPDPVPPTLRRSPKLSGPTLPF